MREFQIFCFSFSMQTNPEELEKLLQKKKSRNVFFPTVENIPNKEGIRYVVQPPIK